MNNTDRTVFVRMVFENELHSTKSPNYGVRRFDANEKDHFGIFGNWNERFKSNVPRELQVMIVLGKNNSGNEDNYSNSEYWDTLLLKTGEYLFKNYSIAALEEKNWLVTFPDDGFKVGNPR